MFEVRFKSAFLIKKIIAAILDQVSEINLTATSAELCTQSMCSSHVSLSELRLRPECATQYRVDRSITIGIPLKSMKLVLAMASDADLITWRTLEDADTLTITIENPSQTKMKSFNLKLMDIDSQTLGIPETIYTCVVRFNSSSLHSLLSELQKLGSDVEIRVTRDTIKFSVDGDMGKGTMIYRAPPAPDPDAEDVVSIQWDEDDSDAKELVYKYSLPYLLKFAKAHAVSSTVTLCFKDEVPLCFKYELAAEEKGEADVGYLRYHLAPKILDEDDDKPEHSAPLKEERRQKVKQEHMDTSG